MNTKSFVGIVKLTKKQNQIIIRNCYEMESDGWMHHEILYPNKKCGEIIVKIDKSNKSKNCHIRNITDGSVVSFDTYYQNPSDIDFKVTNIKRWKIKNTKWDIECTEKENRKFLRMVEKGIRNNVANLVGISDEIRLTDVSEDAISIFKTCLKIADEFEGNITIQRLMESTQYSEEQLEDCISKLSYYGYLYFRKYHQINNKKVPEYYVRRCVLENFKVASTSINDAISVRDYIDLHFHSLMVA